MAASLVPSIIVLALGAGVLGFPDALRVLLDIPKRSPLTDIAICFLAMAVVTAQALGGLLLLRFVRKSAARTGRDAYAPTSPRTDRFAQVTLVVSLGVAILVSACLLVASGSGNGGIGLLCLVAADVDQKMKSGSPIIAVLATAAAVLLCNMPLVRVFRREEDHSHGAAVASSSAWTGPFASMTQVASFTGAAAFVPLAVSGGLYARRGSHVHVSVSVAAVVGAVLLARFTFTRKARNAAGPGGRAAPAFAAGTRRVDGKLTRLAPYLAVVSFVALLCCIGPDGAKYT